MTADDDVVHICLQKQLFGVLKNFARFLLKKRHRCFPVNFAKFELYLTENLRVDCLQIRALCFL